MTILLSSDLQITEFDPRHTRGRAVWILGCGTTGSRIGEALARMGIDPAQIHLVDDDHVESVNIKPQRYTQDDIGRLKVDALADHINKIARSRPHTHAKRFNGSEKLSGYVFLCLDTLEDRSAIWHRAIKDNDDVIMMFDVGIGNFNGKYFGVRPCNPIHIDRYEAHRAGDLAAQKEIQAILAAHNMCATKANRGPTADIMCGIVETQFIKWIEVENGNTEPFENLIAFSMRGQAMPANEIWG
jgi:molybdopterin/thiamine biosynthesis adenylyltransferase